MANESIRIRIDSKRGALASLVDKKSGREFLDAQNRPSPTFRGRPNPNYPFQASNPNAFFDSATSQASITWLEKGPLRSTVRATHNWKQLTFETRITLSAHSPSVEVVSRVLTHYPPATDPQKNGRAERDIQEGYWLVFAPAFTPVSIYRDFPLGMEKTTYDRLHGLTFADLAGTDQGLLIIHSGTQYFKRESDSAWSNLLIREWESQFTGEYGFPDYAEYRHVLLPHGPDFDDAKRARASMEFDHRLRVAVGHAASGNLPVSKSFVRVSPDNVQVSTFRKKERSGYELRLIETAGKAVTARIELGFAASGATETDLQGRRIGAPIPGTAISLPMSPWRFRTLEIA
jgi:hypothetical protein